MPVINNPYRRELPPSALGQQQQRDPVQNNATTPILISTMGLQSQRRLSLKGRTHKMQSQSKRKKKGQLTMFGGVAFDPKHDCPVCKGRLWGRTVHRAHHKLCWNNRRTKGLDPTALARAKEEKRLEKFFAPPLTDAEKPSSRHATVDNGKAFFAPRPAVAKKSTSSPKQQSQPMPSRTLSCMQDLLCERVTAKINDTTAFVEANKWKRAPLAMQAFAIVVVELIIRPRDVDIHDHFDGMTIRVPSTCGASLDPHYHSIIGQKLLYVDWIKMYQLNIQCPRCDNGILINDRSNFSKNKILFPIFVAEGAPSWCIVQSMTCPCCHSRLQANSGEILCRLPAYARSSYPVESKYALDNKNSHIGSTATAMMDLLMPTYGNGDL